MCARTQKIDGDIYRDYRWVTRASMQILYLKTNKQTEYYTQIFVLLIHSYSALSFKYF